MSTYEEAEAAIRRASSVSQGAVALAVAATPPPASGPLAPICNAYRILKPILQGIAGIPFLGQVFKTAINDFLQVMDGICPGTQAATTAAAPNLSFESIDAQVKQALIAYWQQPAAAQSMAATALAAPDISGLIAQVCKVYCALKPVLDFAKPFIPGPWGVGVGIAEGLLDALCKCK